MGFRFPASDLMRPRYCHSGDARMRMQMTSCFFAEALQFWHGNFICFKIIRF